MFFLSWDFVLDSLLKVSEAREGDEEFGCVVYRLWEYFLWIGKSMRIHGPAHFPFRILGKGVRGRSLSSLWSLLAPSKELVGKVWV